MKKIIVSNILYLNISVLTILTGCCDLFGTDCEDTPIVGEIETSNNLNIAPVYQSTHLWCWLATGEMVFRHYQIPSVNPNNYQCGIVGIVYSQCFVNCFQCVSGANSIQNLEFMLEAYPLAAQQYHQVSNTQLEASTMNSVLTEDQIMSEIDAETPILVGINPSGFRYQNYTSDHVALIVGYEKYTSGQLFIIVNDPWPYGDPLYTGQINPYEQAGGRQLSAGSYYVLYEEFVSRLSWGQSILFSSN